MKRIYLTGSILLLTQMLSSFNSANEISGYHRDKNVLVDYYASFEVPVFSITGKNLNELKTKGYEYVTAFFHPIDTDGRIFELRFFGMKLVNNKFDLTEETDKFSIEGSRSFNFPCALANVTWDVAFPPDNIPDNALFTIIPYRRTTAGTTFIYYRWQRDATSVGTELNITGTFNPVPPRSNKMKTANGLLISQ